MTKVQRAKSILDALADSSVTNALALRVADAFAYTHRRGDTLTNEQKAGVILRVLRNHVKQVVRDAEISQALEVERLRVEEGAEISIGSDGDE